jgi:signal transduction histidine kinase
MAEPVPACAELMKEVDAVLSDALQYTRTLVTQLSPPVLRDQGLPAALKWLADQMRQHQLTVFLDLPSEQFDLPENHAVLLFQSVRELLINAAKHEG